MASDEPPEGLHSEAFNVAFKRVKAQVSVDLVTGAVMLQRLLVAVDRFPLGGLYRGHYAEQAIRRYWQLWMPLLHALQQTAGDAASGLIPPLDVQWAWFVHRLHPDKYLKDCVARFGAGVHPADLNQALGFSSGAGGGTSQPGPQPKQMQEQQQREQLASVAPPAGMQTRQMWEAAWPSGPGQPVERVFWPPAPPPAPPQHAATAGPDGAARSAPAGSGPGAAGAAGAGGTASFPGAGGGSSEPGSLASVRGYVADAMGRQGRFLHQMLRYFYQDPGFLEGGRVRYLRFLALARTQAPGAPLLNPMYDQDVMWHTHMALSGSYVTDCEALMPVGRRPLGHDDSLSAVSLTDSFAFTLGRYEAGVRPYGDTSRRAEGDGSDDEPLPHEATTHLHRAAAGGAALAAGGGARRPAGHPSAAAAQARSCAPAACSSTASSDSRGGGLAAEAVERAAAAVATALWAPPARAAATAAAVCSRAAATAAAEGPAVAAVGRPPMLGSPDHLCRSGAFAPYALWCLGRRLHLGTLTELQGQGQGQRQACSEAAGCSQAEAGREEVRVEAEGARGDGGKQPVGCRGQGKEAGPCDPGVGDKGATTRGGRGGRPASGGSCRRRGGGGGGGLLRRLGCCLTGPPGCWGWEEAEAALGLCGSDIEEAVRHMTGDLLRLADLADPSSPLASHRHHFFDDIAPLPLPPSRQQSAPLPPPPQPRPQAPQQHQHQPQHRASCPSSSSTACAASSSFAAPEATSASSAATAPLAAASAANRSTISSSGGGGGGSSSSSSDPLELLPRRHPTPVPPLDLPATYLSPAARYAELAYLAPHQLAVRGQVAYTPADFCLLGPGRWCLPGPLAAEVAERQAAEAAATAAAVSDDCVPADVHRSESNRRRRHHHCQPRHPSRGDWRWRLRLGGPSVGYEGEGEGEADGCGGPRRVLVGNTLGWLVFSAHWPDRIADSYTVVHTQLMHRSGARA